MVGGTITAKVWRGGGKSHHCERTDPEDADQSPRLSTPHLQNPQR